MILYNLEFIIKILKDENKNKTFITTINFCNIVT